MTKWSFRLIIVFIESSTATTIYFITTKHTTFKYIPPDIPLKKYIPLNITLTGIGIEKDQSCNFEMEKKTIQIISIDRCDDYTLDGVFILAVVYNMAVFYAIDFF